MAWNILSFELIVFVGVLVLYMNLRRKSFLSLKLVQGLTTYVPPIEEDFEMLEKTNQGGRENMKGEKNKYDKKKLPGKAKFPLRTIEIDNKFLKHCQEFFLEYDFFFMLVFIILLLFIVTQTAKLISPDLVESNLVFYLMMFTLVLGMMNLVKNTFNLGYCRCTDEDKVQFFFAFKAFFIVFFTFHCYGFNSLFDVNLEKAHEQVVERLN